MASQAAPVPMEHANAAPARSRRLLWAAACVTLVTVAAIAWMLGRDQVEPAFTLAREGLVATANGREVWRYSFGGERTEIPMYRGTAVDRVSGPSASLVAATAWRIAPGEVVHNGQLVQLSRGGALERAFAFDDVRAFGAATYDGPWGVTDFRLDAYARGDASRIAVAAHHHDWWPSLVTVLDGNWRRLGTFVNAGWAERVEWVAPDRLLIAGFFEPLDAGMVALLDARALDGQSPPAGDPKFRCTACGPGAPLRYVVFTRSDVNRASASPFNRASVDMRPGGVIAHTDEVPATPGVSAVDAVYEFTPSLELTGATYSDRYWEIHRQLEAAGKLTHTRAQCPDRNGPREIAVWEPAGGWRTVPNPRAASR
jgi:hypothetical protein